MPFGFFTLKLISLLEHVLCPEQRLIRAGLVDESDAEQVNDKLLMMCASWQVGKMGRAQRLPKKNTCHRIVFQHINKSVNRNTADRRQC